ncbi:MAG: MopE-related protein [Sandaracinus sp.]
MRHIAWMGCALGIASLGAGCTALVDGTLAGRGSDAGQQGTDVGPLPDTGPPNDAGPVPDTNPPMGPCATFPDGTQCTIDGILARLICIHGNCSLTECGDGFADTAARGGTEECDDGNTADGDGCTIGCTFSCHAAADCDDGEECNGVESCGADHVCAPGTTLADDASCDGGAGHCVSGACRSNGCGDGVTNGAEDCDDMNADDTDGCKADCTFTCVVDADCPVADVCAGTPVCTSSHTCTPPTMSLDCSDTDPCTTDTCDPTTGCAHASVLVDADHDTFFAITPSCGGDDCDDTNPNAFPGAPEVCGATSDLNCDGQAGAMPTWYRDCDGDNYAASTTGSVTSCTEPAAVAGCTGGWTSIAPTGTTNTDCLDSSANARPGQTMYFTSNLTGLAPSYDYNCNGTADEQPWAPDGMVPAHTSAACSAGGRLGCDGATWFVSATRPRCGQVYPVSHCTGTLICSRTSTGTSAAIGCR